MKAKKIVLAAVSAALVAAVSIGGTLAYLSAVTETKENVFTSAGSLTGRLEESDWKETSGKNYKPGDVINKTPVLYNTSVQNDAFAAARITCKDNFGNIISLDKLNSQFAEIYNGETKGINTEWSFLQNLADGSALYVLGTQESLTVLEKATDEEGTAAPALFTKVNVLYGLEEWVGGMSETVTVYKKVEENEYDGAEEADKKTEDGKYYVKESVSKTDYDKTTKYYAVFADGFKQVDSMEALPTFTIEIQGYLVQTENTSAQQAIDNFAAMAQR